MGFPECMLPVRHKLMIIQMRHDIRTHYMLQKFAGYAGQGNWAIIRSKRPVSLFEQGTNVCLRPFFGDFTRVY